MWVSSTLSFSTFKPSLDKCIASDGADVVLWATDMSLVKLGYRNGVWEVTRHPAAGADRTIRTGGAFAWCGRRYDESGEVLARFDADADETAWEAYYRDLLNEMSEAPEYAAAS